MSPVSAARNGRRESLGLAAAVMGGLACDLFASRSAHSSEEMRGTAPQRSLPPCGGGTGRGVTSDSESGTTPLPTPPPQGGREQAEFASRSSLHSPDRYAVFLVLKLHAHRFQLV